jgi:S-DNA-T family DNA segregation ATPase FtsK/SpoIIIE
VEVITGLIKANITARVAFQVASQVDSRTILDGAGAEKLLGRGDMLFLSAEVGKPKRIQGAYISEKEVKRIVQFVTDSLVVDSAHNVGDAKKLKEDSDDAKSRSSRYAGSGIAKQDDSQESNLQNKGQAVSGESPEKIDDGLASSLVEELQKGGEGEVFEGDGGDDEAIYEEAKKLAIKTRKASASFLQRRLRLGYARAARIIDMLEERGVIGPGEGAKPREVYISEEGET